MPTPAKKDTPQVPDEQQAPPDESKDTPQVAAAAPEVPVVDPVEIASTGAHIYADDEYVDVWDEVTGEKSRVPEAWLGTQLGIGLTTTDPGVEPEPADPAE